MASSVLAKMAVIIDGQTAQFNKAMAQSQTQLASFTGGLKSVGVALLGTFGAVQIFNGIKAAIGLMAEFEATMSEVKAITGATGAEFDKLQADALRLGAATKYTSTQVAQLQVAYGRLGFNTQEILAATEATLDLAAATGEDLAKSADVAGSTVRGFGLEARETQRVVDVMAASFNQTALGLDNFAESMKYVAPIAEAANVSVEETTALLGVLADAGIRGSSAGTALRKIFGDLSKDGRPVSERLDELGKKGITLTDAFDEVGRTAQTALIVLSKNREKADELTRSFSDVEGAAAAMARTMQDNLSGDVEKLSSAWEGLILSFSKTGPLRDATQALTAFVTALQGGSGDALSGLDQLARGIKEGVTETNSGFQLLVDKIKDIRRETGKPIDTAIAQELADKYKLTEEQANVLFRAIVNINKSLSFQEQVLKTFGEFAKPYKDLNEAANLYKDGLYKLIVAEQINQDQLKKTAAISADAAAALQPQIEASKKLISSYQQRIGIINGYVASFEKGEEQVQAAAQVTVKNLNFYQEALKKVNEAFESLALTQDASGQFTEKTISNLRILAAESAGLEDFIGRVNRLKESFRDVDVTFKVPDTSALTNSLQTIQETVGGLTFETTISSLDAVTQRFEAGLAKMAESAVVHTQTIKGAFIDLGAPIGSALSGIGEALGNSIAGVGNFGQDILKVVAGFARQLGEILISTGVAMLAAKKLITNPYTAIAAGVALVAIASAASAAISKSHSSSIGGGATASSGGTSNARSISNDLRTDGIEIKIGGELRIEGPDLVYIFNRQQQLNGRTRG